MHYTRVVMIVVILLSSSPRCFTVFIVATGVSLQKIQIVLLDTHVVFSQQKHLKTVLRVASVDT